jgi:hypothetical protein
LGTGLLIKVSHTGIFPTQLELGNASNVQDRYEILAYDAQPLSHALGAVPDVSKGVFAQSQNLMYPLWPQDLSGHFYKDHRWHSAEFRFTNADQENYWNTLMKQFGLPTN